MEKNIKKDIHICICIINHFTVQSTQCCKLTVLQFFFLKRGNKLAQPIHACSQEPFRFLSWGPGAGLRSRSEEDVAALPPAGPPCSEQLSAALPAHRGQRKRSPWSCHADKWLRSVTGWRLSGELIQQAMCIVGDIPGCQQADKMRTTSSLIMTWSKEVNGYCFCFSLFSSVSPAVPAPWP